MTIVKVEKVRLEPASGMGILIKKGKSIKMKTNILPDDLEIPKDEPKWYYQQLWYDKTWTKWQTFAEDAYGEVYNYKTKWGGIFRVKTVFKMRNIEIEKIYVREKDEVKNGYRYGPGKKGKPDAFGVADTYMQIYLCREAQKYLGSDMYSPKKVLPSKYGFPEYPNEDNGVMRCNIFVAHMATAVGAVVPKINGNLNEYPPTANEWAGVESTAKFKKIIFSTYIKGWELLPLNTYPQPG